MGRSRPKGVACATHSKPRARRRRGVQRGGRGAVVPGQSGTTRPWVRSWLRGRSGPKGVVGATRSRLRVRRRNGVQHGGHIEPGRCVARRRGIQLDHRGWPQGRMYAARKWPRVGWRCLQELVYVASNRLRVGRQQSPRQRSRSRASRRLRRGTRETPRGWHRARERCPQLGWHQARRRHTCHEGSIERGDGAHHEGVPTPALGLGNRHRLGAPRGRCCPCRYQRSRPREMNQP